MASSKLRRWVAVLPPAEPAFDLETQVKGKLSLENVDIGPIIEVLKSITKELENLERRLSG